VGDVVDLVPAQNPDVVLKEAIGHYAQVLILGYDAEGYLDVRGSLGLDKAEILMLIEQFKFNLMSDVYDME
jgi:hypothetical protein